MLLCIHVHVINNRLANISLTLNLCNVGNALSCQNIESIERLQRDNCLKRASDLSAEVQQTAWFADSKRTCAGRRNRKRDLHARHSPASIFHSMKSRVKHPEHARFLKAGTRADDLAKPALYPRTRSSCAVRRPNYIADRDWKAVTVLHNGTH